VSYATKRDAEDKVPLTVWDILGANARFVQRQTPEITAPLGWTLFAGAAPEPDQGSRLDIREGKLSIGGAAFLCPDLEGQLAAWLAANDGNLSGAKVIRRMGFAGLAEADYQVSRWRFVDYGMKEAGVYRFELDTILEATSAPLFEDFDGERYELAADITSGATTITLAKTPSGIWREPGTALLWNSDKKFAELIEYQSIGGTGNKDLQTVTRRKFGVGSPAAGFAADNTDVFHVWARRSNPVDLLLELLTTREPEELVKNGNVEAWDAPPTIPDGWTYVSGTVGQSADAHGGSFALSLTNTNPTTPGAAKTRVSIEPEGATELSFWAKRAVSGQDSDFGWILRNVTRGYSWRHSTLTWIAAASTLNAETEGNAYAQVTRSIDRTPFYFSASDVYELEFQATTNTNAILVDDVSLATGQNGAYDLGTADGLGIDEQLLDVAGLEAVRDEFWPQPTFTGDALTAGTAVLFVERKSISDLWEFIESHLLRPFALAPATDAAEKLTADIYFRFPPPITDIEGEWRKRDFRAGRWKRAWRDRLNNLRLLTDWNTADDDWGLDRQAVSDLSIARFGKSKPVEVEGRGGRSGLFGFPDYGSASDMLSAAGRILLEVANPGIELPVRVFWKHKDLSIVDAVRLDLPGVPDLGVGRLGIDGGTFVVASKKIDQVAGYVELQIRERRPVSRPAFVAPDTVASTYGAASAADRAYAYIASDAALFANGDGAYTTV